MFHLNQTLKYFIALNMKVPHLLPFLNKLKEHFVTNSIILHVLNPLFIAIIAALNCILVNFNFYGAWTITLVLLWIWSNYVSKTGPEDQIVDVPGKVFHFPNDKSNEADENNSESGNRQRSLKLTVGGEKTSPNLKLSPSEWINVTISKFWKNLKAAIEDCILNLVWPKLRRIILNASTLFDMELYSFALGMVPPRFNVIKIIDTNDNKIILDFEIVWASEAVMDFRIRTGVHPVYLKLDSIILNIKGRVTINSLSDKLPYFKSFSVCLKEFPIFQWRVSGVMGDVANSSLIQKQIRRQIFKQLRYYVFPNRISVPALCLPFSFVRNNVDVGGFQNCIDEIFTRPDGILKVFVKSCRNLPSADWTTSLFQPRKLFKSPKWFMKNILPKRGNSDPFIEVKVGSLKMKSKTIFRSHNPEFDFNCEIPLECAPGCNLIIDVYDFDKITENDLIGRREENLSLLFRTTEENDNTKYVGMYS